MRIKDLKMEKPFRGLFPIKEDIVSAIRKDMEINGYDLSHPIIVWNDIVIDGNTRVIAAKLAKLKQVPVDEKPFKDEQEALKYAIHNQRDRRNMTDADLLRCIEAVDKRKAKGERTDLASSKAKSGKSAKETAEVVGTSKTKVEKARTVLDHADDETKQEVFDGKKSIHKAAKETQEKKVEPDLSEEQINISLEVKTWKSIPEKICKISNLVESNCRFPPLSKIPDSIIQEIKLKMKDLESLINSLEEGNSTISVAQRLFTLREMLSKMNDIPILRGRYNSTSLAREIKWNHRAKKISGKWFIPSEEVDRFIKEAESREKEFRQWRERLWKNVNSIFIDDSIFETLALEPSCSIQDAKRAFRTKAKELHPDHGGNKEDFIKLNEDYRKVLSYLEREARA